MRPERKIARRAGKMTLAARFLLLGLLLPLFPLLPGLRQVDGPRAPTVRPQPRKRSPWAIDHERAIFASGEPAANQRILNWELLIATPQVVLAAEQNQASPAVYPVPLGLPPIPWPDGNPYSPARAELGRMLFFDGRLSANGVVACSFCHDPEHGFAADTALSRGVDGAVGARHAPTLINRAWGKSQFWDGRAATLEEQTIVPLTNPHEMGMTPQRAVAAIRAVKGYAPLFAAAFGDSAVTLDRITKAIATFERTIVSGNSAYDRYMAGDKHALTKEQQDGLDFFNKKGECAECHRGPDFSDEKYANIGVGMARTDPDPGRADITRKKSDFGRFKVPTLRDLAVRAPYMHDGSVKTLSDVLNIYAKGGEPNPHLDNRLAPFYLDEETRKALLAFLDSLQGEGWRNIEAPEHLPQ